MARGLAGYAGFLAGFNRAARLGPSDDVVVELSAYSNLDDGEKMVALGYMAGLAGRIARNELPRNLVVTDKTGANVAALGREPELAPLFADRRVSKTVGEDVVLTAGGQVNLPETLAGVKLAARKMGGQTIQLVAADKDSVFVGGLNIIPFFFKSVSELIGHDLRAGRDGHHWY